MLDKEDIRRCLICAAKDNHFLLMLLCMSVSTQGLAEKLPDLTSDRSCIGRAYWQWRNAASGGPLSNGHSWAPISLRFMV